MEKVRAGGRVVNRALSRPFLTRSLDVGESSSSSAAAIARPNRSLVLAGPAELTDTENKEDVPALQAA
jgi:hypothetical protein